MEETERCNCLQSIQYSKTLPLGYCYCIKLFKSVVFRNRTKKSPQKNIEIVTSVVFARKLLDTISIICIYDGKKQNCKVTSSITSQDKQKYTPFIT